MYKGRTYKYSRNANKTVKGQCTISYALGEVYYNHNASYTLNSSICIHNRKRKYFIVEEDHKYSIPE